METVRVILLSFRNWYRKVEGCAIAEFAVEPDASSLHFHKALGDIQPQTCTRCLARLAVIRTEESLEDPGLIFEVDADAIILHPEMRHMLRAFRIPLVISCFCSNNDV